MDQTDHRSRQDDGRGEATDGEAVMKAMPAQVRDTLRRRLLVGGTVAAPLIVTFGRARMALAASADRFTKIPVANPNPIPETGPRPEIFVTRADMMLHFGGTVNPDGTPVLGPAETVDNLILSGGGSLGDIGGGQFGVIDPTNTGCFASNGITVERDFPPG